MFTTTSDMVWNSISKRPRSSHKGTFGSVLAVAGSASYRGAAALAVEGALRTGAGIVTLASVEPVLAAVSARLPECCLCPCEAGAAGGILRKIGDAHRILVEYLPGTGKRHRVPCALKQLSFKFFF